MILEKDFILSNKQKVGRAGAVMTPYLAKKLLKIDRNKYSHLLIVMDTFDYDIYSVEVPKGQITKYIVEHSGNMQRVKGTIKLEPTNESIKNYMENNEVEAFYDLSGKEM